MISVIVTIIWLVLDQISKGYIQEHMHLGESVPVIANYFHITYIVNKGAAFGILSHERLFLIAIVLVVIAVYGYSYQWIREQGWLLQSAVGLLVGGAVGNGYDRFVIHGVVDFFDLRVWPIFNVADIGICIGVIIIALYLLRSETSV